MAAHWIAAADMMMKQLLIATGVLAAGPAYAWGEIFNSGSSCTTNCDSTILNATIKSFPKPKLTSAVLFFLSPLSGRAARRNQAHDLTAISTMKLG
jgi:hypothetical protein